jgi:hypothetical protein
MSSDECVYGTVGERSNTIWLVVEAGIIAKESENVRESIAF